MVYMETLILLSFCFSMLICLLANLSVLYALWAGLFLFLFYAWRQGFSFGQLCSMVLTGIWSTKTLAIVFLLVGMLTGLWRASGTIPMFLYWSAQLFEPKSFLLVAFLLNCALSFLTGTSLGSAATMGMVTVTVGIALGVPAAPLGGAVLSGVYFGDRCSPFSTSALLIRELTHTDTYRNIHNMFCSAAVPFLISILIYLAGGFIFSSSSDTTSNYSLLFQDEFVFHPVLFLPAVLVLLSALLRLDVKLSLLLGILSSALLCLLIQKTSFLELLEILWYGYSPKTPALYDLLQGGGILSLWKAIAIVCLTCSYSDIFRHTGLLSGTKLAFQKLCRKLGAFPSILCVCVLTASIACNQTLCILLTHQLCEGMEPDRDRFALSLEDTSALIPALLPWSVACTASLSAAGAPINSIFFACYLWLIPAFGLFRSFKRQRHSFHAGW